MVTAVRRQAHIAAVRRASRNCLASWWRGTDLLFCARLSGGAVIASYSKHSVAYKHYGSGRTVSVASRCGVEVVYAVCQLCPGSNRQFAVYPGQVGFHGLDGHEEFRGGLLV